MAADQGHPRFALYLPQLRMDFDTIEGRVRTAEELGFHSVWFMDHLAAPAAPEWDTFEAWTLASAIVARTSTIRLGHLVLCDPFRHPALLAKMAATLDVISGGRLELGLGWGSVERELATYGFAAEPSAIRAARLGETLEILELMFDGERFDYEGRFYHLSGGIGRPRPVNGRIPVHIGGSGPKLTLPLAAKHADWWNCPSSAVDRLEELSERTGRARISVQHPVGLASDTAALEETRSVAENRFGGWGGLITGTPEQVAEELSAEAAKGVELFILQFSDFGQPETLERFMNDVAPGVTFTGPAGSPGPTN